MLTHIGNWQICLIQISNLKPQLNRMSSPSIIVDYQFVIYRWTPLHLLLPFYVPQLQTFTSEFRDGLSLGLDSSSGLFELTLIYRGSPIKLLLPVQKSLAGDKWFFLNLHMITFYKENNTLKMQDSPSEQGMWRWSNCLLGNLLNILSWYF